MTWCSRNGEICANRRRPFYTRMRWAHSLVRERKREICMRRMMNGGVYKPPLETFTSRVGSDASALMMPILNDWLRGLTWVNRYRYKCTAVLQSIYFHHPATQDSTFYHDSLYSIPRHFRILLLHSVWWILRLRNCTLHPRHSFIHKCTLLRILCFVWITLLVCISCF